MQKPLFIIGNGFDLRCGLKTKYSDFFEWLRTNDENFKNAFNEIGKDLSEFESKKKKHNEAYSFTNRLLIAYEENLIKKWVDHLKINIWELYFICNYFSIDSNSRTWANIETEISKAIILFKRLKNETKSSFPSVVNDYTCNKPKLFSALYQSYIEKIENIKDDISFFNWLLSELRSFEMKFCNYCNYINSCNKALYNENAYKLLSDLYYKALNSSYKESNNLSYILNFNYTNPFKNNPFFSKVVSVNVHGHFENENIIFGVDDYDFHDGQDEKIRDKPESIFSKTYRKLLLISSVVPNNILDNDISHIIFYGHSLSRSDYSYFQSIFDYYNLYDSHRNGKPNIKLIFFYSYYKKHDKDSGDITDETKSEIKFEYTKAVYNLIHEYGKSLENEYKGKNLIHKLLLEERLKIKLF